MDGTGKIGGRSFHHWLIESAYVDPRDEKITSGRRRKKQASASKKGSDFGVAASEEAAATLSQVASVAGRRKARRWLNDRLLRDLAGPLDASDICALYAPPPWGLKSEPPVFERITQVGPGFADEAVAWEKFRAASHDSDLKEASLLSRSRQAASRSESEALRAWRRVDRHSREALKRCRDWPLVRILEEIVVHVGSNPAPRVELELLAEQLEGGDEGVMLFYREQRRRDEVSKKVTLFLDSPFQRLLLHALCQFHDVAASSSMLCASSVDGENLSPTCSHEARSHEVHHAISIEEENMRAGSGLRLADVF